MYRRCHYCELYKGSEGWLVSQETPTCKAEPKTVFGVSKYGKERSSGGVTVYRGLTAKKFGSWPTWPAKKKSEHVELGLLAMRCTRFQGGLGSESPDGPPVRWRASQRQPARDPRRVRKAVSSTWARVRTIVVCSCN